MPEVKMNFLQRLAKAARFVANRNVSYKKTPFANTTIALANTPQYALENFEDYNQELR